MNKKIIRKDLLLFFILIAAVAFGNGLSDSIYANYYKDVYHINATQRAFIEFPRELPGLLCVIVVSLLTVFGDIKISFFAQLLALVGVTVLGLFTPSFGVMLIFLFINSLGMHLFFPLQDSLGMKLAEKEQLGRRMGQFASVKTLFSFFAGILVFIGFRVGFFTFLTERKSVFLVSGAAFLIAAIAAFLLVLHKKEEQTTKHTKEAFVKKKAKIIFRKEYKFYYILATLNGVQKQIAYVFGSWVIVDLLIKGADVMSFLIIVSSFIGIFFMNQLGKWIDKLGVKKMLYLDALTFIVVYFIYGIVVWAITANLFPDKTFLVLLIYVLFISDRLSMQIGVVKSVYLKQIAIKESDITPTLSLGISLDHGVSIVAAQISGLVWMYLGPQWVFFFAAFLSVGNLYVAYKIKE